MDRRLKQWLVALLIFNTLDALTTWAGLSSGNAIELNPLMAAAWNSSPLLFLAIKTLYPVVFLGLLLKFGTNLIHTTRAVKILAVLFGVVVLWNCGNLLAIQLLT